MTLRLVLISCKAYDLERHYFIRASGGPGTVILPLLNGVRHSNSE
jgi:hypothetical protein